MKMQHEGQWCEICGAKCDHDTAQHAKWKLTKRPAKPISKPIVNRDPRNLSTR